MSRLKTVLIPLFLLLSLFTKAHPLIDTTFARFVQRQDSLFIKAYEDKNVKAYQTLLAVFLEKYNRLSADEKKMYLNDYINAYYNLCCTYSLLKDKPRAIECLKQAVGAGYSDYAHILADPDLEPIRSDKQFKAL